MLDIEAKASSSSDNQPSEGQKLKPKFENLNSAETFINHVQELKEKSNDSSDESTFPIQAFPAKVQEIIKSTNESLNFPIDFIGSSLLYAASIAIGNTHKVTNGIYEQSAVLYLALVGRAGTSKSHPLSYALEPINEIDNKNFQNYLNSKQEYDKIVSLNKKERQEEGPDIPEAPVLRQFIVSDITPESLAEIHKINNRGIGMYSDELAGWFKNFNRYNKGSEEQFWLSVWSGKFVRINRKTSDPIFISSPFISVAGTIQPGILDELAKNRTENGFLDRLLFVMPQNLKKHYWSKEKIAPAIKQNWKTIIDTLMNFPLNLDDSQNPMPTILEFTTEAQQLLFDWQVELTDVSNQAGDDVLSGIYAKLEPYALRLALCLELLQFACGESSGESVGIEATEGALQLVDYFKDSAIKVHSIISNTSPVEALPRNKQTLFNRLPDYFTTGEGVKIAEELSIPERTFKNFIRKEELFANLKRGEYKKLY